MKKEAASYFRELQQDICRQLEALDGRSTFAEDAWERPDLEASYGGGGFSRVLTKGNVFEKAGVNFSEVSGTLPASMCEKLTGQTDNCSFFASGVSLVLHPESPMVPTTHANVRYLEVGEKSWFGGGSDLTPYYFYEEDAVYFHTELKKICDRHNDDYYQRFKEWCDTYFYLPHRKEARGVGGLFFDYLGKDDSENIDKYFAFTKDVGDNLMHCYIPIADKRQSEEWSEAQRKFQLQRRGRYAEFNLLYDRGTKFGLETNGRTESILMSMPPVVHWDYCPTFDEGSREAELISVLSEKREWC